MKKVLITIIVAFATAVYSDARFTVIDFNYKRSFPLESLWIDFNLNGEMDSDEAYVARGSVSFDYRHFKTKSNRLFLSLDMETTDGGTKNLTGALSEVIFVYTKNEGRTMYIVQNKLKENEFGIVIEDGVASVLVFNPLIFIEE